jgi:hypothetical protein
LSAKQADILGFGLRFGTQPMIHRHGNQPGWVLEHGHIVPEEKKQAKRIAAARNGGYDGLGLLKSEWLE